MSQRSDTNPLPTTEQHPRPGRRSPAPRWIAALIVPAAALALLLAGLAQLTLVSSGCGDDDAIDCPEPTLDIAVCDPANGPFSLEIDNPYFPLAVGDVTVLEGTEDGETLRVEITVFDQTEDVAGVTTRVVEERESEGGELVEVSRNFFAQAPDGTVCYFGEDVDDYEDGAIVSHSGAWRTGVDGNRAGIMMPANPSPGQIYFQESAPGLAEDMGEITATGASVTTPAGTFANAVESTDCNPLDGSRDEKVYAPGLGLVVDEAIRLVSSTRLP